MHKLSDLELVKKVQDGDDSAFSELMHRHYGGILNYILRFTHNANNSEDLTQDVFLRVYKSIGKYKPEAKFTTWLYKIATNVCLTAVKNKRRHAELSVDEPGEASLDNLEADHATSPDNMSYRQEIGTAISTALGALPERERISILLCKYEEMRYDEVAEVIGCSVGAVKAYVYRGRMKLIDILGPLIEEEGKGYG